MGLTINDLENLIRVIDVGNIIKISLNGISKKCLIKSKQIEENTLQNLFSLQFLLSFFGFLQNMYGIFAVALIVV